MASLPKPLSQKTIQKMIESWKPETVNKLHDYYAAFSNLFGVIILSDAWNIMKKYEPNICKKEFMDFSSIARREELPYYILEIDELYCDEPRVSNAQRFIVNKELVLDSYYRFTKVYKLVEMQLNKPFYYPEKMTDFTDNADTKQWNELCHYIRNIKNNDGVKLSELVLLNEHDKFELEYYKSQKKKDQVLKRASTPLSERLIKILRLDMNIGEYSMDCISRTLIEANVSLSTAEFKNLMHLWQEANNHSHLWANCGWSPIELHRKYSNSKPKGLSFRPVL